MGLGKMGGSFIDIVEMKPVKDAEGFTHMADTVIASTRAFKEDRHGNKSWANRAAFSTATALFRFRILPGIAVTPEMSIACADGRYRILSVEDVRGRGMYLEALAEMISPSLR